MTQQFKYRENVYISDPHYKQYRFGQFTGYLTESHGLQIAYVEVFDKSSRKQGLLETICVDTKYLSTDQPIRLDS